MNYDNELTLIGASDYTTDSVGNQISTDKETTVLCGIKSIGRNEFYSAAVAGLKPEIIFVIHGYEYSGEKKLRFENSEYDVIRTYGDDFEELELTCRMVTAS